MAFRINPSVGNSCKELSDFLEQPHYSEFRRLASLRDSLVHRHSSPQEKAHFDELYNAVLNQGLGSGATASEIVTQRVADCSDRFGDTEFLHTLGNICGAEGVARHVVKKIEEAYRKERVLIKVIYEFNRDLFPQSCSNSIKDHDQHDGPSLYDDLPKIKGIEGQIVKNFWYHPHIHQHSHPYDSFALSDLYAQRDALRTLREIFSAIHQEVYSEDLELIENSGWAFNLD